jgi:hypothetical protein
MEAGINSLQNTQTCSHGPVNVMTHFTLLCHSTILDPYFYPDCGGAIALGISSWLPTATGLVRVQVRLCGICGGQNSAEAGFLRMLPISLSVIPLIAPYSSSSSSSSSSRAGTIDQAVVDLPSGLSLTPPLEMKTNCTWTYIQTRLHFK